MKEKMLALGPYFAAIMVLFISFTEKCYAESHATVQPMPEKPRKLALGYDVDVNGVNLRYMAKPKFGLDFTLGFNFEPKNEDAGDEEHKFGFNFQFGFVSPLKASNRLWFNFKGGIFLQYMGSHMKDSSALNLAFFGGFAPELFIFERLSVEILFGLAIALNNITEDQRRIDIGTIGKGINIISGASFRYYF